MSTIFALRGTAGAARPRPLNSTVISLPTPGANSSCSRGKRYSRPMPCLSAYFYSLIFFFTDHSLDTKKSTRVSGMSLGMSCLAFGMFRFRFFSFFFLFRSIVSKWIRGYGGPRCDGYTRDSGFAGKMVVGALFGSRAPFSVSFVLPSGRGRKSFEATSRFRRRASFFSRSTLKNNRK